MRLQKDTTIIDGGARKTAGIQDREPSGPSCFVTNTLAAFRGSGFEHNRAMIAGDAPHKIARPTINETLPCSF